MASERFWLEVDVGEILERLEEIRENIIEEVPYDQLYTLSGEVNNGTRWGRVLWTINQTIASFRAFGF